MQLLQDAVERDNPYIRAAKRRAIERISIADDADFFYGTCEGGDSISIASGDIADPPESVTILVQSSVRDVMDLTGTSTVRSKGDLGRERCVVSVNAERKR